jgi:hypothetical protein
MEPSNQLSRGEECDSPQRVEAQLHPSPKVNGREKWSSIVLAHGDGGCSVSASLVRWLSSDSLRNDRRS